MENKKMITVRMAEINIGICYRFEFTFNFLKEYITDSKPDFTIEPKQEDIDNERLFIEYAVPDERLEYIAIYRMIAEKLSEYDAAVFHAAVIECEGKAFMIMAKSGVGKTTHVRLWLQRYKDTASVLNGDKPILRIMDGKVYVCGTPYMGKEGYGKNKICPLGGIAFLKRAEDNSFAVISPKEGVLPFMKQIYISNSSADKTLNILRLSNKIISTTPLFEFRCNMDISAAEMAHYAFLENNHSEE